jgi:uncharacterized membrane protein YeaQ/YmgE (transglycosylase-associated protein family)
VDVLWFVLVGIAAGFLAGRIRYGTGFGTVGNLIVGVLGAVLGGFLFRVLGLGPTNLIGSLISATVGAVLVLAILRFVLLRK